MSRRNPSQALVAFEEMCDGFDRIAETHGIEEFSNYYAASANEPEVVLAEGRPEDLYPMRNFVVVGTKGRMLRVYPDAAIPMDGNIFDWSKLCAVANAPKFYDFKIPLIASLISPWMMTESTLEEALMYQEDGEPYVEYAEFDEDDEGEMFMQVRDGNHRLFGMLLSGEPYVWGRITSNDYQDYNEWVKQGKPSDARNIEWLTYLDENLA